MKTLCALLFAFVAASAIAADNPYNETADAKLDIKNALAATNTTPIVLVFGGNWCPDCRMLDLAMKQGASAELLARDFRIIKIDVGHFDKKPRCGGVLRVLLEKRRSCHSDYLAQKQRAVSHSRRRTIQRAGHG